MLDTENQNLEPKGLLNLGLSCYMNSLLQCLYYIPELREYFIENIDTFSKEKTICKALAEVMYGLKFENTDYYIPRNFRNEIRNINNLFLKDKACDVKDLFINLIDTLLEEMKNESGIDKEEFENNNEDSLDAKIQFENAKKELDNNIINELFGGFYLTAMKCDETNTTFYSIQNEAFMIFELKNIYKKNNKLTLYSCFDYFKQKRYSSYYCENCKKAHEFEAKDYIYELPKILVLILDRGKGKAFKEKLEFNSEILILKDYMYDQNYTEEDTYYQLFGLSTHAGLSSSSGHYTACCLTDNHKYYYFSDTIVEEIQLNQLYENEPYLLFYRKIDKESIDSKKINSNNIQTPKYSKNENKILNESIKTKLEKCLKYFLSNKNNNYSIDYYFKDTYNPLIWKLIINIPGDSEYEYEYDKYIFKLDFNKNYKEYLTDITTLETPISHLNFENTSLLFKYSYNKERNLLENIKFYIEFLYNLFLKPDLKLFKKYCEDKIKKYTGKIVRLE